MSDQSDTKGNSLWRDAASFSARAHAGQTRRDGATPYAAHPARVALTVSSVFGCDDPETLAIALLHDTIEDSTTDYEDLLDGFGKTVADGVVALTKDAALPEAERDRHAEARLRAGDWRATLVKLADVLDNSADLTLDASSDHANRCERLRARAGWAIDAARVHAEADAARAELLRGAAEIVEQTFASI